MKQGIVPEPSRSCGSGELNCTRFNICVLVNLGTENNPTAPIANNIIRKNIGA